MPTTSESTTYHDIAVLPGDGIGPEIMGQALRVLEALSATSAITDGERLVKFHFHEQPFGGAAIDMTGEPLPPETWQTCQNADAVLLGAVGGPAWDGLDPDRRPEQGLLQLRKRLATFANLRPIRQWLPGEGRHGLANPDMLIVRELTGGIYFGEPRGINDMPDGSRRGFDTLVYTEHEVERVARVAFEAARLRHRKLTSVDKANALASSRLWRQVVERVGADYPDVALEHHLVDSFAVRMVRDPETVDVVVTGNLFGDILSDLGGGIVGTLGVLPSASLGDGTTVGIFEPIHGSAPDIAGQGVANPLGMILSAAMMLRHALGLPEAAERIETAVQRALASGLRTRDMATDLDAPVDTVSMTEAVIAALQQEVEA